MNILMMTNTFTPHLGGVARSVEAFTETYRKLGHRVLVVAPEFENMPADEVDVIRIPAIQHFNGSDFSVVVTTPGYLTKAVETFRPDVVHAHHPFLIGGTALRMARAYRLPLVFTHHTMYERYTHYVPGDSEALKRFVMRLSTNYANLCDQVFAPSESVAEVLRRRGVAAPLEVVPTGVDLDRFARGSGAGLRDILGIPRDAFVVGHLGRLAPEKNLDLLGRAICRFLACVPGAHVLVAGHGPSEAAIRTMFDDAGFADRLHLAGPLEREFVASAYRAMDVFAFASTTETQGLVLVEAMAAGVPVVGLDAPGVREVVVDGDNGRLVQTESASDFAAALESVATLDAAARRKLVRNAHATAERFSITACAERALACYRRLSDKRPHPAKEEYERWSRTLRLIEAEWDVLTGMADAAGAAMSAARPEDRSPA
jgi:1,2-diacylglycerol 3-alpha-glucosyltransferase